MKKLNTEIKILQRRLKMWNTKNSKERAQIYSFLPRIKFNVAFYANWAFINLSSDQAP